MATNIVGFIRKMKIHRMCISVTLSTELIRWTQAARGAAGWANVALCAASGVGYSASAFVAAACSQKLQGRPSAATKVTA